MNESGIHPVGHCVLILLDEVDTKINGFMEKTEQQLAADRLAQTNATVVEIGSECWDDESQPRCKVGDKITFRLYAGEVKKGKDEKTYRIVDDRSIYAVRD